MVLYRVPLVGRALPLLILTLLVLFFLGPARGLAADQVCDPTADYYLGIEDYPEAIRLHEKLLASHSNDALAHYHLGFAYGMLGLRTKELHEYQRAVGLGLTNWDLFLNLGLVYLEEGRLEAGTRVLKVAALLAPARAETHFNLALAYVRRGMVALAKQETLISLKLDPEEPDALNTLGAIYAQEGKYGRARQQWMDLLQVAPGYSPACTNLRLLDRLTAVPVISSPPSCELFGQSASRGSSPAVPYRISSPREENGWPNQMKHRGQRSQGGAFAQPGANLTAFHRDYNRNLPRFSASKARRASSWRRIVGVRLSICNVLPECRD